MKTLVIGSGNKHKAAELQSLLKGMKVRVLLVTELGKKVPEVVENGRTFEQNACKKARAYSLLSDYVTLADDSGLCVRALNNRPGIYSARFAGLDCTYKDNNTKILSLLKGRPQSQRSAYFNSTIAVYHKGKRLCVVKGICQGRIALEAKGTQGFGYDPVFIPQGSQKTYAQMAKAAKNRVSHRGKALRQVKLRLKSLLK